MSLKEHIKAHNKAYSLGFLAIVAAVVGFLFIQTDNLTMQNELTGALVNARPIVSGGRVLPPSRINSGVLNVSTNLADGAYRITLDSTGSLVGSGKGTSATSFRLAPGSYTVQFGTVNGYTAPQKATTILQTGSTFNIVGNYVPVTVATGSLEITKTPALNTILVNGDNTMVGFNASAKNGPVTLSQMTFELDIPTGVTVSQYRLLKEDTLLATSSTPSFAVNETILEGQGNIYYLLATVIKPAGVIDPTLTTRLAAVTANGSVSGLPVSHTFNPAPVATTGKLNIGLNLALGSFKIYSGTDTNNTVVLGSGNGVGFQYFVLPASAEPGTAYKIVYGDVSGFITPATTYFNLVAGTTQGILGDYKPVTVAAGTLTVAKTPGLNTTLTNGVNRLIGFTVTASPAISSSISKMGFEVVSDAGVNVSNYQLFRGATLIATSATPTFDLANIETISAGTSQTYYLEGTVSGSVMTGSELSTRLATVTSPDATVTGLPIVHVLSK